MNSPTPYAIVRVGGKQYKVHEGDELVVDRLAAEVGETVALEPLMVRGDQAEYDAAAADSQVTARVIDHLLGKKIRVFTYKPKSTFKKMHGHRSRLSKIAIESIAAKE